MQRFLEAVGGRKFFLALLGLGIGVAVDLATERGLSENLMIFMISVVGAFGVTNVASKKVTNPSSSDSDESKVPAELEERIQRLDEMAAEQIQAASQRIGNVEQNVLALSESLRAIANRTISRND